MVEKKVAKPIEKKYYEVKVECTLPATVTYRILAETPEQALDLIKGKSPNGVKHRLAGRRDIKVMVYDSGSTIVRLVKNLLGR